MKSTLPILLFSVLIASACSDSTEDSGASSEPSPDATETHEDDGHVEAECPDGPALTVAVPDMAAPSADCSLEGELEGKTFLVDGLILSKPDDALTLSTLNPLWEADIEAGKLMLLFQVTSYDAATGTATVAAGSGCYDTDHYGWHVEPAELTLQVTGCSFETSVPATISIWPASMNKPIAVTDLKVDGHFSASADAIPGANLEGSLSYEDAQGLEGQLGDFAIDLVEFLDGAGVELDVDLDGDGEMDAWAMAGELAAHETANGPE